MLSLREVLQGRVSECTFPEPHLDARHVSPGVGLACRAPSLVGGRWREDGEVRCSEQEFMHEAADYHDRHAHTGHSTCDTSVRDSLQCDDLYLIEYVFTYCYARCSV
jgi:hypothetical protein